MDYRVADIYDRADFREIVTDRLCVQGKNQRWLAEQCRVTQAHISMLLSGKANPSNRVIFEIANSLGVEVSMLKNSLLDDS